MTTKLLTAVVATGAGSQVVLNRLQRDTGVFQVSIADTATVHLEGRTSTDAPWELVKSYTASKAEVVDLYPFMRATVSAWTAGTVDAWIAE